MNNIVLMVNNREREVLVNWDNVNFASSMKNPYGDEYVEINFGGNHHLDVSDSIEEIGVKLTKPSTEIYQ